MKELRALLVILPLLPYAFSTVGLIMGWRYHNAGLMLASLALAACYAALVPLRPHALPGSLRPLTREGVAFLLPLNLAYFSFLTKRRLFTSNGVFALALLLLQSLALFLLCAPMDHPGSEFMMKLHHFFPLTAGALTDCASKLHAVFFGYSIPLLKGTLSPSVPAFLSALLFLSIRHFRGRDAMQAGFVFCRQASPSERPTSKRRTGSVKCWKRIFAGRFPMSKV